MKTPRLELYPPVEPQASYPPTWEDIERLSLHFPPVHDAVTLAMRGDLTREQALIQLVFALADSFQKMFAAEVERRQNEPIAPFVLPKTE